MNLFFPSRGDMASLARSCCARCDVHAWCAASAAEEHITPGVWGGLNPRARRKLKRAGLDPRVVATVHTIHEPDGWEQVAADHPKPPAPRVLPKPRPEPVVEPEPVVVSQQPLTRRQKAILAGLARGLTQKQVAELLGIGTATVSVDLAHCNSRRRPPPPPAEERRKAAQALAAQGLSVRQIGVRIGVDHSTVARDLRSRPKQTAIARIAPPDTLARWTPEAIDKLCQSILAEPAPEEHPTIGEVWASVVAIFGRWAGPIGDTGVREPAHAAV